MKILVTGYKGQLGFDVVKRLEQLNIECKGVDVNDFDLTNREQTMKYILEYCPDAVIHCAAYTAVDKAEEEQELCYTVNVDGTENIAEACEQIGAKIVYISTDYVFHGEGVEAFSTEHQTKPINHYGFTKVMGEIMVKRNSSKFFIIRVSWVFGLNGNNFIKTMIKLGKEKKEISVISDQIGSPTYTRDLAILLCDMVQTEKFGIYHATNEGYCSWNEFAKEIMKISNLDCVVNSITTDEYPTKAKRPLNSRLDKSKLEEMGFSRLRHWKDAVREYILEELK